MRAALALALVLAASPASASAPDLFGYGARGIAMASTLTATAAGHEAVYYNPGGLAFARRPSVALGFQSASYLLSINGQDAGLGDTPAITIGLSVPLPLLGPLEDRFVIGFGFVLPQTAVLLADIPRPGEPRFVQLGARAETVSLMGAVGVRLFEGVGIGAGFIALSQLTGEIGVAPNDAGKIGSQVRDELVADYALIAGLTVRPFEALSFGLSYRDPSDADFTLPITADLGDRFPLAVPVLDVTGTAQYDPREIALAAAWSIDEAWLLAASVVWQQWSEYQNPIVYTSVGPDVPPQPVPSFTDTISGRLAAEHRLALGPWQVPLRAGLAFEPTPAPEQVGFSNYLDNHRVVASLGAGLTRWGVRLDLGAQLHALVEREDVKDPSLLPPPGLAKPRATSISHGGAVIAWTLELGAAL